MRNPAKMNKKACYASLAIIMIISTYSAKDCRSFPFQSYIALKMFNVPGSLRRKESLMQGVFLIDGNNTCIIMVIVLIFYAFLCKRLESLDHVNICW